MGASTRLLAIVVAVTTILVSVLGATAFAATSGKKVKGQPDGLYYLCSEAEIVATADNKAFTSSHTSSCGTKLWSGSGYLGVRAYGCRDGSLCSYTSWHYNSSTTWEFGVGGQLCSNPAGTQEFWTKSDARGWRPNTGSYLDVGLTTSLRQSY